MSNTIVTQQSSIPSLASQPFAVRLQLSLIHI